MMASVVARQPATSVMARVDRLDLVLSYLEELLHHRDSNAGGGSSSSPSTTTSGGCSCSSPRGGSGWRRGCRPAKEVLEEAQAKGSLVDRIAFLEDRLLKMEEGGMEITPETERSSKSDDQRKEENMRKKKKGLKQFKSLVKSCVGGGNRNTTTAY